MKLFDKGGNELVDLIVGDESYRNRRVMGEDSITLKVQLFEHVEIPVGAYCLHQGETYTLLRPQNIRKNHTRSLEYTLVLEAYAAKLGLYKFRDKTTGKLKFSITGKPLDFMSMLLENLNQRESDWTLGACIEASEKSISFNHNYCNEALKFIADAFETEFEITGKTLTLHKVEYGRESPLALSYGKGNGFRTGVRRENFENSHAIDILFVQGGARNIDASKYGSTELLLPKNQTLTYEGRTYQTDESGLFVSRADKAVSFNVEDSLDCSHLYPSRIGQVSSLVVVNASKNFYDFIDATIPEELNYKDCLIAGEKMTVVFQDGMLAGKEFDCDYSHQDRKFQIVPQEIDGQVMPNDIFKPVMGDTYAIFGISLPEAYICNDSDKSGSSWDMFREAVRYLYENEDPRFSFTGELDPIWAKKKWLEIGSKIRLGGYVAFSDDQFQAEPVLIRIIGIKDYINSLYSPEIELSNVTIAGGFSSTIKKLETTQVVIEEKHKESIRYAKRSFRDAQETTALLKAAFSNFSNSISPATINTIQLLVGDESLQFRFVDSNNYTVEVSHSITYDIGRKVLMAEEGVLQHMTIGIEQISSSHNRKVWLMEAYQSSYLDNIDSAYYLYAKVERDGNTGVFLLSEQPIKMVEFSGYYHLLVAIVNSEFQGDRSIALMYGFSEILPGRVTTNRIVSSDGRTYFDLQNGVIGGNISFRSTGDVDKNLSEWANQTESSIRETQLFVEYSSDKINWHTEGLSTDRWVRQKVGANGVWSEPIDVKGTDAVNVQVWSDSGNTFTNGQISTVLYAFVYKGLIEISSQIPANKFNWVRQSNNPAGDAVWNSLHNAIGKTLSLTNEDISRSAIFLCEVDIDENLLTL